jgi:hypothetical protein
LSNTVAQIGDDASALASKPPHVTQCSGLGVVLSDIVGRILANVNAA